MKALRLTVSAMFLTSAVYAGEGTTSITSLKIPTSARASAMGGAFSSVSGDVSAMEYNPAGLSNFTRTDLLASYISYIEDSSLQSLSVGFPVRALGLGIQYRVFSADDTERTNTGIKIGDFDVRDQVFGMGMAYPFGPRLSLGVTGKYIGSKIQNETANTFAFDGGAQYKLTDRWTVASAFQNMGSGKAYRDEIDPLPSLLRVGIAREAENLLLSVDVSRGRDEIMKEALGAEFALGHYVKLRGGVFNDTQVEFSGGLGVRFAGPQKAPVLTAPRRSMDERQSDQKKILVVDTSVASPRINDLYKNIAGQYKSLAEAVDAPSVMIFPLKSNVASASTAFTDLLTQKFSKDDDFTVTPLDEKTLSGSENINSDAAREIANRVGTTLILMGSVEKIDNSYLLNARLLDAEEGKILANAYEEFPAEALKDPSKKNTISEVDNSRSRESMDGANMRESFSKTDIGLDYSFSTRNDLGLIHTVSLRILY